MKPTPSATPDPASIHTGPPARNSGHRTFEHLQKNDRAAVRTSLSNLTRSTKWKDMTVKDRAAAVKKTVSDKLKERYENPTCRSASKEYADHFDEDEEIQYFLRVYMWSIEWNAQQDDDKELPQDMPRIKKEKDSYESESEDEDSDESEDTEESTESDDEADGGKIKPVKPTDEGPIEVVCRGLVINTEPVRVGMLNNAIKLESDGKTKAGSLRSRIEPRGIVKEQTWKDTRCAWKWVDGKLMVWPPFEAALRGDGFR